MDPQQWDVVKDGGTFKQITGATISSRAVTHCIARALELFEAHRAEILDLAEPERKVEKEDECKVDKESAGKAGKKGEGTVEKQDEEIK